MLARLALSSRSAVPPPVTTPALLHTATPPASAHPSPWETPATTSQPWQSTAMTHSGCGPTMCGVPACLLMCTPAHRQDTQHASLPLSHMLTRKCGVTDRGCQGVHRQQNERLHGRLWRHRHHPHVLGRHLWLLHQPSEHCTRRPRRRCAFRSAVCSVGPVSCLAPGRY